MPTFYYDGELLHYRLSGAGVPVLLVHGLGCSGVDWALQVSGCGLSAPPKADYSIAGFASALWALLDHLEVSRASMIVVRVSHHSTPFDASEATNANLVQWGH